MTFQDLLPTSELIDLLLSGTESEIEEQYKILKLELGSDYWIPGFYRSRKSGKFYRPHHREEAELLFADSPTHILVKGGEGSGKSVFGIIKSLERIRRGLPGIMVSPDLPHFKKSLWREFQNWCCWEQVVPNQQKRASLDWEPNESFTLNFKNGAYVLCGGIESPIAWEGPNVNWAHFDEARRHKTPAAVKVLTGRIRIPGANDEPPQLTITTTPAKHWLFDYFGQWEHGNERVDPLADFKINSRVMTLRTRDNEKAGNLERGYTERRGQGLTEAEKRVILDAEWEDTDTTDSFLPSITLWDNLYDPSLPADVGYQTVVALDAAVNRDCFGMVVVSRHPTRAWDDRSLAVRYVRVWKPREGIPLDLNAIEQEIGEFCVANGVALVVYDPYQMERTAQALQNPPYSRWVQTFTQTSKRLLADKALQDMIFAGKINHNGDPDLREHLKNADQVITGTDRNSGGLRIVKRVDSLKIDLAVCLSMAAYAYTQEFM